MCTGKISLSTSTSTYVFLSIKKFCMISLYLYNGTQMRSSALTEMKSFYFIILFIAQYDSTSSTKSDSELIRFLSVGPSSNLLGLSGLPAHQQQLLNAMQQQPQLVSHSMLNSLSASSNPTVKSPIHRTHHSYSVSDELCWSAKFPRLTNSVFFQSCEKLISNSNSNIVSSSSNNNSSINGSNTGVSNPANGCSNSNALSAISRLTANNTDITITPTPAPAHQTRTCDSDSFKREQSESPISDTCDLLDDSPSK